MRVGVVSRDLRPLFPPLQTTSGPRCDITVGGLNPEICYDFRVRARPRDFHYGTEAMPSEWTGVMSRRGAGPPGE